MKSVAWAASGVAAALLLAAAVAYELVYGFRLGETAGSEAELVAGGAIVIACVLVFAPFGRGRCLLAAGLAAVAALELWAANTEFTTSLDVRYGGAYGYSGERVAMVTWFVGPWLALITGGAVLAAAHLPFLNPTRRG